MENLYYLETLIQRSKKLFSQFLFEMNAKFIVEEPNCSKNLSIASCNDITITNNSSNFRNTKTLSTV